MWKNPLHLLPNLSFHNKTQDRTGLDWGIVKSTIEFAVRVRFVFLFSTLHRRRRESHSRGKLIGRVFKSAAALPAAPQHFTFKEKLCVGPIYSAPPKKTHWLLGSADILGKPLPVNKAECGKRVLGAISVTNHSRHD